jgi:hypothetical protein
VGALSQKFDAFALIFPLLLWKLSDSSKVLVFLLSFLQ